MNLSSFGRRWISLPNAATANATLFALIPTLTGGGIKFPATQVPSADPNTLDDYEEGTWTPGVSFANGTTGQTYSAQVGSYTKVGRKVYVFGAIVLTAKGSSTGQARITGLPFTAVTNSGAVNMAYFQNLASLVDGVVGIVAGTSGTTIDLRTGGAASAASMTEANFTDTTNFYFSSTFHV